MTQGEKTVNNNITLYEAYSSRQNSDDDRNFVD